jgi:hypothetical protein
MILLLRSKKESSGGVFVVLKTRWLTSFGLFVYSCRHLLMAFSTLV